VPEPTALVLFLLAAAAMPGVRRGRYTSLG